MHNREIKILKSNLINFKFNKIKIDLIMILVEEKDIVLLKKFINNNNNNYD